MPPTLFKKRLLRVFSCEFFKTLRNSFSIEHLRNSYNKLTLKEEIYLIWITVGFLFQK